MLTFLAIIWPPIIVFSLHVLRVLLLPEYYRLDMIAHFLGGAAIALVAWNTLRYLIKTRSLTPLPRYLAWFLCIATAELVGVLWEFWEFYIQSRFMFMGITLEDTLMDLVLDLVGATVCMTVLVYAAHKKDRRQKPVDDRANIL